MKKILVFLALSMALVISACGASGSSSSESQAPAATVEKTEASAAMETTEAAATPEAASKTEGAAGKTEEAAGEAAEVIAALKGIWLLDDTEFTFEDSTLTIVNDKFLMGDYKVNTSDLTIDVHLEGFSGAMVMQMTYTYQDGKLTLKNDEGKELTKKE